VRPQLQFPACASASCQIHGQALACQFCALPYTGTAHCQSLQAWGKREEPAPWQPRYRWAGAVATSFASHNRQLAHAPVKQPHDPGPRFAAAVLVWIVRASAAASPCEVTFAVCLNVTTRAPSFGVAVGHGCSGYLICGHHARARTSYENHLV
jgi:hypothetical protein